VRGSDFGLFLSEVFDEWVRRGVGVMFIPFFDAVLASYLHGESTLCVLRPACGDAPVYLLGNILETPVGELLSSERQRAFGRA